MLALLLAVQMLEPLPITAPRGYLLPSRSASTLEISDSDYEVLDMRPVLPEQKYDPHGIRAAVAVYAVGATLDLWSTEYALAHGGVEANPIMRGSFGKRLAIKTVQVSLISAIDVGLYTLIETRVHSRLLRWLARLAWLGAHAALAAHNYRVVTP